MPRFGRACFASSLRAVFVVDLVTCSGQRSRVVAMRKQRPSKRQRKEKAKASPCQRLSTPKLRASTSPPFSPIPFRASSQHQTHSHRDQPPIPQTTDPPSVPRDPNSQTAHRTPPIGGIPTLPTGVPFVSRENLGPRRRLRPLFPELVLFPVDCAHPGPSPTLAPP